MKKKSKKPIPAKDRWITMNRVLLIIIALIAIFAFVDSQNLIGIKQIDAGWQEAGGWNPDNNVWTIFWGQIQPWITFLWYAVLGGISLIWYQFTKDKSESLALFLAPAALIFFGSQDLLYFVFSPDVFSGSMCWADVLMPIRIISNLLGETCPTSTSFVFSGLLGVAVASFTYYRLKIWSPK